MNGLLSRSPSPAVVRPLLGVALLAPVGAILLLSLPTIPGLVRLAAGSIALLSIAAIISRHRRRAKHSAPHRRSGGVAMTSPPPDRTLQPAALQLTRTGALLLAALLLPDVARAEGPAIGRTWPIAEPDALAEIEAKAARLSPIGPKFGARSQWPALKGATLAPAPSDRVRTVIPFHTLKADIVLPDGRLLYPKGFTFNPLAYVSLPQRLVIVTRADLGWALATARPSDFILIAESPDGTATPQPDILALSDRAHRPLFLLEERAKNRLGLTVAPVIVRQAGQKLELAEVRSPHVPAGAPR
jgi:conjugal transfer pilus assembly protein TraW